MQKEDFLFLSWCLFFNGRRNASPTGTPALPQKNKQYRKTKFPCPTLKTHKFVGFGVPDEPFCLHNAKRRFLFYLLMFVFRTPHHRYAEPLPLEKPQWVCAFPKQKEGKFNSPLIVRLRVVGDANPYKVGAYLMQKERIFNFPS